MNFELSKLFAIGEADFYNIYRTWIRFMSLQWNEIDCWPCNELVKFYSTINFRKTFPSTTVFLQDTECLIKN